MLWQPDCGKTWKRPQSNKLIAETDNDKHWQSYLYEPDSYRPLALVHGNAQQDNIKLYWYQNDHLGTPIALTGSLGDTLYECQYNAYGQIINETYHQDDIDSLPDNPLRFQGQYYDEETGLHYNLNRYYDPFIGRYITQDPLGILGGLNSYQYAGSDPINWIDPLGLIKVENSGFEGVAGKEKIGIPTTTAKDPLSPVQQYDAYGNEIVYRTMSQEQFKQFERTGIMPPTTETSISPVLGYSSKYNGVTVKIVVKQGTFAKLEEIGIAANSAAAKVFPNMSIKTGKWMKTNTRFKVEGGQMTTQLGQGRGIEIFNENIVHFEKVK
ncbi:hypothetical protein A9G41_07090 [Gilliamella sp. Nev5-1]|uniref:RHS repeat-associated core domain-containing protein n=2 Tax=Gilliamella sp. Nev5-1 TaxID=3120251 RepID=UPI0008290D86|nr:RHS repeat-associated core domain-containing protein [Gilliamella apicola]OCG69098.1 hypothetical protein A9G41_07090 [Gilliamella apicola]